MDLTECDLKMKRREGKKSCLEVIHKKRGQTKNGNTHLQQRVINPRVSHFGIDYQRNGMNFVAVHAK